MEKGCKHKSRKCQIESYDLYKIPDLYVVKCKCHGTIIGIFRLSNESSYLGSLGIENEKDIFIYVMSYEQFISMYN